MFLNRRRGGCRSSVRRSSRNALGNGAKRPDDSSSKTNFFILHAVDLVSALSVSLSAALSSELSRVFSVTRWLSPKYISERMQMLSEGQGHFHTVPLFLSLFIFFASVAVVAVQLASAAKLTYCHTNLAGGDFSNCFPGAPRELAYCLLMRKHRRG